MSEGLENQLTYGQVPKKSRRTTVFIVLAVAAILVLLVAEGPREIARWYHADAQEKALDGKLDGAIESMDAAIQWNDALEFYLVRAQLKLENEDFEGCLDDCGTVIEQTQDGPVPMAVMAHELRGRAYLVTGRFQKAVEDVKVIGELRKYQSSVMKLSNYLNSLAYYRAVGGIELDEAVKDATKAVELLGDEQQLTQAILRASLSSEWRGASPILKEIVAYLKQELTRQSQEVKQEISDEIADSFPPAGRSAAEMSRLADEHLEVSEQLRLLELRQTRPDAIVTTYEEKKSSRDGALQTALGGLPDMQRSQQILAEFAPLLDTKGFAFYKLAVSGEPDQRRERLAEARHDLDRAVVAMEVLVQAERTMIAWHKHRIVDPRSAKARMKQTEESLAVLRYHRGLVLQEQGELQLAARDFARVKELGHEPNEQLY